MPLPPALAARLQKRGIHVEGETAQLAKEEILHQNYESDSESDNETAGLRKPRKVPDRPGRPVPGCPNTKNAYHTCSTYCRKTYGKKDGEAAEKPSSSSSSTSHSVSFKDPSPATTLHIPNSKFPKPEDEIDDREPLPPNWHKVVDPISRYSYYWNVETDLVSWLHPGDPDAVISLPASKLKQAADAAAAAVAKRAQAMPPQSILKHTEEKAPGEESSSDSDSDEDDEDDDDSKFNASSSSQSFSVNSVLEGKPQQYTIEKPTQPARAIGAEKPKEAVTQPYRSKRARKAAEAELDPMDPASYDETVPRGTWKSGLVSTGTKAADSTAAGPIFQQRPYPSPGDVLRANKAG